MDYTNNIKAEIMRIGSTQKEISKLMGMSEYRFSKKINCKNGSSLSINEAIELCRLLSVSLDKIFLPSEVA